MKSLMTFVFLMPMIFSAASAAANDRLTEGCRPVPFPSECPIGMRRVFDEYRRRYICVPNDDYEPRPLPWREDRMKELSGILGGDDMAAKGEALAGLFDSARNMKSGADKGGIAASAASVASAYSLKPRTGDLKLIHTDPSVPVPSAGTKSRPKFLRVDCSDSNGCRSETGKVIEDATSGLGKLVDKLIGDPLRDSGDAALKKGNEDKKRAEDEWKKK